MTVIWRERASASQGLLGAAKRSSVSARADPRPAVDRDDRRPPVVGPLLRLWGRHRLLHPVEAGEQPPVSTAVSSTAAHRGSWCSTADPVHPRPDRGARRARQLLQRSPREPADTWTREGVLAVAGADCLCSEEVGREARPGGGWKRPQRARRHAASKGVSMRARSSRSRARQARASAGVSKRGKRKLKPVRCRLLDSAPEALSMMTTWPPR